jgi:hypothetical protein
MFYDLYTYDTTVQLLYDNGKISSCFLDNRPMESRIIKVHKGVDNVVKFKVYDADKKVSNIDHLRVSAILIDTQSSERVFKTYCKITNKKGQLELDIKEDDLINIPAGFFKLVLTAEEWAIPETEGYVTSTPFYTDPSSNINMNVQVMDSADKTPIPTIEITTKQWIYGISHDNINPEFVTQAFPANRMKNSKNGSHTIAIHMTNFKGEFQVYGTLDSTPSQNLNDYFPLDLSNNNSVITYDGYTGIDAYHFQANVMWLKFRYKNDPMLDISEIGTIDKVQLRS